MNKSESIKELAAALAKAQGEMEGAPKDAKNQFGGYYADLGSVIQAAQKPLSTNGLSITQHPELVDGMVTVTTMLMHASGEWLESSISAPIGDNRALSAAQQAAIVITYLRRYSYAAIVGIYADEDTDGAAPQQARQSAKPAQAPAPNGNGNGKQPAQPPAPKPQAVNVPAMNPVNQATIEAFIGEPVTPAAVVTITLEDAENIVSSTGERYGDLPTTKLAMMCNSITKTLRTQVLNADERADKERRYAAASLIIKTREAQQ